MSINSVCNKSRSLSFLLRSRLLQHIYTYMYTLFPAKQINFLHAFFFTHSSCLMVRFKNRYLLCFIETEYATDKHVYSLQPRDLLTAVRSSLAFNFGDLAVGQSMSSLAIKLWSPALAMCLIRCSRDHLRTVWAATSLITALTNFHHLGHVRLSVIHVGGTIRSCQKSAAEHARKIILVKRAQGEDTDSIQLAATSVRNEMDAMDI